MKRTINTGIIAVLMIVLLVAGFPTNVQADEGSDGAAITVGLLACVLGVLLIVGAISDYDYFTKNDQPERIAKPIYPRDENACALVRAAARASKSDLSAPVAFRLAADEGLGLKVEF